MWEVKKGGYVMAHGPMETFPSEKVRRCMVRAGYKIYVDGKVYKEKGRGK